MNWLNYLLPGELASLAITLTGLCNGVTSCTHNFADIFLVTLTVWCLWLVAAMVVGIILYSLISHIFGRPARKTGGRP